MCPIIIKWIGLGIGLTVWDLTNMLMGWATGRFGLFMIHKETVNDEPMNYAGLGLAAASLFLFAKARDLPEPEESNDSSQRFQAAKDMKKAETAVSYVADLP